mgnify:FL=1
MDYYHKLNIGTEENIMSVKLQPSMTQNARDLRGGADYWAYDNDKDYIEHVEAVCQKYSISSYVLFEMIGQ